MKPFLVIQLRPENETSNSEFEAILHYGQLSNEEVVRLRIEDTGIPGTLNPLDYSGILVGGSPFDISTPKSKKSANQIKIEADFKRLFDVVVSKDIPFLGMCSGNGLLGSYCGVPITRKYSEPVGGVDITLTPAGVKDTLLKDMPTTFRVLAGHKEACDYTPAQAELLASSHTCPVHMFRLGKNVYATQFHPEGDAEGFCVRIDTYQHHGYFPSETAEKLKNQIRAEHTPYAHEILRRFVAHYRNRDIN